MYYSEIREFDLTLSGKSENYQGISFHELIGNPDSTCVSANSKSLIVLPSWPIFFAFPSFSIQNLYNIKKSYCFLFPQKVGL